jgi:hypothetical protein
MQKGLIPGVAEDLLRAFLEHIPDGVHFKDLESRFVGISRSLAARFGLSHPGEANQHRKHLPKIIDRICHILGVHDVQRLQKI